MIHITYVKEIISLLYPSTVGSYQQIMAAKKRVHAFTLEIAVNFWPSGARLEASDIPASYGGREKNSKKYTFSKKEICNIPHASSEDKLMTISAGRP